MVASVVNFIQLTISVRAYKMYIQDHMNVVHIPVLIKEKDLRLDKA